MRTAARVLGVAVAVVVAILLVGPQQFGGPIAVVSTYGNSMLPTYEPQHLVIVGRSSDYEVGDVIAYRSGGLETIVLHRIVDEDVAGFVTKGDNNDWLDPDRPTHDNILGETWLAIPKAGRLVGLPLAGRIAIVAALVFLPAGVLSLRRHSSSEGRSGRDGRKRRRTPPRHAVRRKQRTADGSRKMAAAVPVEQMAAGAAMLLVGSLALGAFALSRPTMTAGSVEYAYHGGFSYHADVRSGPVYPDGSVDTGEPVFRRFVDVLPVRYDWTLDTEGQHELSGTQRLLVEVSDGSGWSQDVVLAEATPFEGAEGSIEGTLDLPATERLVRRVQAATGLEASGLTLTVIAEVDTQGSLAGVPFSTVHRPSATFQLEPLRLVPPDAGEDGSRLVATETGTVSGTDAEPSTATIGPFDVDVRVLRLAAAVLGALSLLVGATAAVARIRRGKPTELDRIRQSMPQPVIEVTALRLATARTIVQVATVEALAELAEGYEQPVLEATTGRGVVFMVETDTTCYRYLTGIRLADGEAGPSGPPVPAAVPRASSPKAGPNETDRGIGAPAQPDVSGQDEVLLSNSWTARGRAGSGPAAN